MLAQGKVNARVYTGTAGDIALQVAALERKVVAARNGHVLMDSHCPKSQPLEPRTAGAGD